jgi:hypothetical protein
MLKIAQQQIKCLNQIISQSFAKYDRSKNHVNGIFIEM